VLTVLGVYKTTFSYDDEMPREAKVIAAAEKAKDEEEQIRFVHAPIK